MRNCVCLKLFMSLKKLVCVFAGAMAISGTGGAYADDFPNRPIRIVTSEIGGGVDMLARLVGQGLTAGFGQQVIVDNRGGSVSIPAQIVAKAPADGYTLFFYGSPIWILPLLQKTPYDPVRDFSPITMAVSSPNILVVNPGLPVNSVKELIGLAKAKPGELNYGAGVAGASAHLSAELFKSMAGVNIAHVAYKGSPPALAATITGEVQMMFAVAATVPPHQKAGRVRALAVTSLQPSELAPGLPTVAAAGLPGYESVLMVGVYAPANIPAVRTRWLNTEIVRVLRRPDMKEKLYNLGMDQVGSSPEQLFTFVNADMVKWGKVIKEAGIHTD
jgi:tripartite-type tricarboxylate transporter receptor subunit TctC